MSLLAIIGGTGLSALEGLEITEQRQVDTPYGQPSSDLLIGEISGKQVVFLPRHGRQHTVAPHKINYRANIWALQQQGVDQIIDYTYGREQSFFGDDFSVEQHIDFSYPYDDVLRQKIMQAAKQQQIAIVDGGTYGATQGPRLETAAEIQRMAQDGCAMVGMTGMPEACLARELNIAYATCALMVNWGAGIGEGVITMAQIEQTLAEGMDDVKKVLTAAIQ